MKRRVIRFAKKGKCKVKGKERVIVEDLDSGVAMIQALIPIGLEAVAEQLQQEVEVLAGKR